MRALLLIAVLLDPPLRLEGLSPDLVDIVQPPQQAADLEIYIRGLGPKLEQRKAQCLEVNRVHVENIHLVSELELDARAQAAQPACLADVQSQSTELMRIRDDLVCSRYDDALRTVRDLTYRVPCGDFGDYSACNAVAADANDFTTRFAPQDPIEAVRRWVALNDRLAASYAACRPQVPPRSTLPVPVPSVPDAGPAPEAPPYNGVLRPVSPAH